MFHIFLLFPLYYLNPSKPEVLKIFFTVSGSTLLRENVFILVLVYPDFLLALEPGEKKLRQEKKVRGRRKKFQAGEKGFLFLLVGHNGFRLTRLNDQTALWSSGD